MFSQSDFMSYLNSGEVPTVFSKQQAATSKPVRRLAPKGPVLVSTLVASPAKMAPLPVKPVPSPAMPAKPVLNSLELVSYSDRSFAIFGETRPLQAKLEALGGKFNRWLKRDGIPTPGYIFSINRIDNVRKALNL